MKQLNDSMSRRGFLRQVARFGRWSAAVFLGATLAETRAGAQQNATQRRGFSKARLEKSEFAYISPLDASGAESTCHAELWYAWLDESVVVIVSRDGWKARALSRGRSRARVWLGNHGRWKGWFGSRNEDFRGAMSFDAEVERIKDKATLEALLARYETKYPAEIEDWRARMRTGFEDGSRVLLRYRPSAPLESS